MSDGLSQIIIPLDTLYILSVKSGLNISVKCRVPT